jgi:hypothetical protein
MTSIQRRSWMLVCLAALGAAGMFLGPDGWLGIDIGPLGSAILYGALALLVIHLSRHADEAFPLDASLAERQAWVATAFVTLIYLRWLSFMTLLPDLGAAADEIANPASRRFAIHLGMLIVAWIVVARVVRSGNHEAVELDERDLRVQNDASRAGSALLAVMIIGLISALATRPEWMSPWLRPLIVANALVGLLIGKTLTENVYAVLRYRRGRA